jgi:hypothetical protein
VSLTIALASASPLALAALKDKPPEGLKLAGTEWQLDPYHSDDASAAVDRASRVDQPTISDRTRGGVFGGDDPFGRGRSGTDPIGGGSRTGDPRDRTTDPRDRTRGPNDRSRGWPGRDGADIDPTGGNAGVTMQFGKTRGSLFLESLRSNPEKLTFDQANRVVTVTEDGIETECEAGEKAPFSDSYGDGERSCGWSGRTWVVETTRGKLFSRTDRYELSKDGRTLRYTTNAKEEGVGRVTIERRYQIPVVIDKGDR